MTTAEREAFDAMRDALDSIYEVDDFGDGYATVTIDYVKVEAAQAKVAALTGRL